MAYLAEGSWRTTCGGEAGGWSWLQVAGEDVDGRGRKKKKKIYSGEKEERKERREKEIVNVQKSAGKQVFWLTLDPIFSFFFAIKSTSIYRRWKRAILSILRKNFSP